MLEMLDFRFTHSCGYNHLLMHFLRFSTSTHAQSTALFFSPFSSCEFTSSYLSCASPTACSFLIHARFLFHFQSLRSASPFASLPSRVFLLLESLIFGFSPILESLYSGVSPPLWSLSPLCMHSNSPFINYIGSY